MHKEDTIHMEAYEKVLETWMELITSKKDNVPMKQISDHAIHVFNSYVQCHISPPDGCRLKVKILIGYENRKSQNMGERDSSQHIQSPCMHPSTYRLPNYLCHLPK